MRCVRPLASCLPPAACRQRLCLRLIDMPDSDSMQEGVEGGSEGCPVRAAPTQLELFRVVVIRFCCCCCCRLHLTVGLLWPFCCHRQRAQRTDTQQVPKQPLSHTPPPTISLSPQTFCSAVIDVSALVSCFDSSLSSGSAAAAVSLPPLNPRTPYHLPPTTIPPASLPLQLPPPYKPCPLQRHFAAVRSVEQPPSNRKYSCIVIVNLV